MFLLHIFGEKCSFCITFTKGLTRVNLTQNPRIAMYHVLLGVKAGQTSYQLKQNKILLDTLMIIIEFSKGPQS